MSNVRAKFVCRSKLEQGYDSTETQVNVVFEPVHQNSEENARYFRATPGGKIELNYLRAEVAAQFEIGKEYFVDFTPAK